MRLVAESKPRYDEVKRDNIEINSPNISSTKKFNCEEQEKKMHEARTKHGDKLQSILFSFWATKYMMV